MNTPPTPRFFRQTLLGLIGPLVWSGHLAAVYGASHLGCAFDRPVAVSFIVTLLTALCFAVLVLPAVNPGWLWRRRFLAAQGGSDETHQFLVAIMRVLTLLSMLGIAWGGSSVAFLTPCAF